MSYYYGVAVYKSLRQANGVCRKDRDCSFVLKSYKGISLEDNEEPLTCMISIRVFCDKQCITENPNIITDDLVKQQNDFVKEYKKQAYIKYIWLINQTDVKRDDIEGTITDVLEGNSISVFGELVHTAFEEGNGTVGRVQTIDLETQSGGKKKNKKVRVLGRDRVVTKVGRKSMVTYKGKQISLGDARKLEKAMNRKK